MGRFKKRWLVLAVMGGSLFLFHKPLLLTGFKIALNSTIPKAPGRLVSYRDIQWENEQITLLGLEIKDAQSELIVERIEITPRGSLFRFAPEISVIDPEIRFRDFTSTGTPALPFLFRSKWFNPKWKIDSGMLEMPSKEQLYFSMVPGNEAHEMGTIALFDQPGQATSPMFTCNASMIDEIFHIGFKLQHNDLAVFLPLSALIFPEMRREWESAKGILDLEGNVAFNKKLQLCELDFSGSTQHLSLVSRAMGIEIHCDESKGAFSYPASEEGLYFWDKLSANLSLRSATCLLNTPLVEHTFGMQNVVGEMRLEPSHEPQLSLNGMLVQMDRQLPFTLSGKGSLQQDDRFWSVLECQCTASTGETMQALLSFCRHEQDQDVLQLKVDHATFEHLDFFRGFHPLPGQCVAGTAHLEATWLYQKGACQQASIDSCTLDKMRWYFPKQQITAYVDSAKGECALERNTNGLWEIDTLQIDVREGDLVSAESHFSDLNGQYGVHRKEIQPSHFQGKWEGLEVQIDLMGSHGEHFAEAAFFGDARHALSAERNEPYLVAMHATIDQTASRFDVTLRGELAGEPVQGSLRLHGSPHLLATEFSVPALIEAEGSAEVLTPKSYSPFLPQLLPGLHLAGTLACQAHFSPTGTTLSIGGEEILLQHPFVELQIPAMKGNLAQFQWSSTEKKWSGSIPVFDGKIYVQNLQLPFDNVETKFVLGGSKIQASSFYAECEGLALRGHLDLDLHNAEEIELSLATSQIAGSMQNFVTALSHLPSGPKFTFPIAGSIASGENGFVLKTVFGKPDNDLQMQFKAGLQQVGFPLRTYSQITDGNCEISFDWKEKRLEIEKAEAKWNLKEGAPLTVRLHQFSSQFNSTPGLAFALEVVDGNKEKAHFEGNAFVNEYSHWEVAFDPLSTHFFGTPLNISRCLFDRSFRLLSFEMDPIVRSQDILGHTLFFQNAGLINPPFSTDNLTHWQLEGTFQARLSTENAQEGFSFHAESQDLKVKGKPWSGFLLRGQKLGQKWLIETFEGHGIVLRGAFVVDANGLTIPQFGGEWLGMQMQGSGYIRTEQKRFGVKFDSLKGEIPPFAAHSAQGTFAGSGAVTVDYNDAIAIVECSGDLSLKADLQAPIPIVLSTTKPFHFGYTPKEGLICEELDLHFRHHSFNSLLAKLQVKNLHHPEKSALLLKGLELSASPVLMHYLRELQVLPAVTSQFAFEDNLEVSGDLNLGKEGPVFQGNFRPGKYGIKGKHIDFEQLMLRYEKQMVSLRGKTLLEASPLWMLLQVDISEEPFGVIKFFDDPKTEGLKGVFSTQKGMFQWESIHGRCYGVHCNLSKSTKRKLPAASVLEGDMRMDAKALVALFPKEIKEGFKNFKVGSGYEWKGDLVLWNGSNRGFQMNGTFGGTDFELFGYRLKNMKAVIEATPSKIEFSELKIEDAGGHVKMDSILLSKTDGWDLYIPQITVNELQPSLLAKVEAAATAIKPFTIKSFVLKDVRGKLGDKSTLEGSGKLAFTNQFKKEFSILDIPLEMIKNVGLDPGILTPINGELDLELRGDKFYLMGLTNAYSEGNRSEFYLAPTDDLSYIDLDGKMRIDLKLRQEVVLKLIEPFTLTIRGTLDKPRYGLQF